MLPKLTDDVLQHATLAYDPVKAHEYYLQVRKLKGRLAGAGPPPVSAKTHQQQLVMLRTDAQKKAQAKAAAHAKAIEQEVIILNARLLQLKEVLKKLVAQAQGHSGVTSVKATKAVPTKATATKKTSHKTAVDKAKAHALYLKNKANRTPEQQVQTALDQIKQVRIKIQKMRMDLQDAQRKSAAAAHTTPKQQQNGKSVPAVKQATPIKK